MSLERIRDRATANEPVMKEKYRRNHSQGASGESPIRNHSQRACGEKNRGQRVEHRSDDALAEQRSSSSRGERMKRTEKSKANSRQDKSTANSRQGKPKDYDSDKSKYEEKYPIRVSLQQPIQLAMQLSSSNPSSQPAPDVQQGQYELKLDEVITTVPKIDFDEKIVEYEKISSRQLKSKDSESPEDREDHRPQVRDPEHRDAFSQLEADESAQQAKAAATSRRSLPQSRRSSNRTLQTFQ